MEFDLFKTIEVLERTPKILEELLSGLPDEWTMNNEGEDTWSPYDIIGHLNHGERTDWIERADIILHKENKNFILFDRFTQFKESEGKSLQHLLSEFAALRKNNLQKLKSFNITEEDLDKTGIHTEFGEITLRQL